MDVQPEEHCSSQLETTRSCAACSVRKGLIFLMLCKRKPARSSSLCNVLFEGQLVIKDYTKISLTEVDGVIIDVPN